MKKQNPLVLYAALALLICSVATFVGVTFETNTQKPQVEAQAPASLQVPAPLGKTAKGRQFSREAREALHRAVSQPVIATPGTQQP